MHFRIARHSLVPRVFSQKELWLRLVKWLPKSGSQNYRRGRRVIIIHGVIVAMTKVNQSGPDSACCLVYNYQLMARVFENVNNSRKNSIV